MGAGCVVTRAAGGRGTAVIHYATSSASESLSPTSTVRGAAGVIVAMVSPK